MASKAIRLCLALGLMVTASAAYGEADAGVTMPNLVGLDLKAASKSLGRMGLEAEYVRVEVDTAEVAEFHVAGQEPDSGVAVEEGQVVKVRFNCHGMLRYWDDWAVPLLADFKNTVGFYRVNKPPRPLYRPEAGYPLELLKYTFTGEAKVEALVDFDGSVLAARVTTSSGHPEADSAACVAALQSEFSPAEHYERAVRVWFPMTFAWRYEDVAPELSRGGDAGAGQTEP